MFVNRDSARDDYFTALLFLENYSIFINEKRKFHAKTRFNVRTNLINFSMNFVVVQSL